LILAERRTHEGLSKPEIIRCLKRRIAREIFNALPMLVPENSSRAPTCQTIGASTLLRTRTYGKEMAMLLAAQLVNS